jgi:Arc/MetJ-type ribon-helix-helix transcriptional regulator
MMKTLRISDGAHEKLTELLGDLTIQTKTLQTYTDAIEQLLSNSVILPKELLAEVENYVRENKHRGYISREDFIRDAIRFRLDWLNDEYEYFEVSKEQIEKMEAIMEALGAPINAKEYIKEAINKAVKNVFEEYESRKEGELSKKKVSEIEERLKEIEESWETSRKKRKI